MLRTNCVLDLIRFFRTVLVMDSTQMPGTLFKMAVSGRHPALTMFFLKARGGWSENHEEGIEPDRQARWTVQVYQPPRTPEAQNGLEVATAGVQEAAEWEEFNPT